jgi:hypothetical protein
MHPECPDSDPSDGLIVADAPRQEPAEEDEGDGKKMTMMTTKTTTATRSERAPVHDVLTGLSEPETLP